MDDDCMYSIDPDIVYKIERIEELLTHLESSVAVITDLLVEEGFLVEEDEDDIYGPSLVLIPGGKEEED